MQKGHQLQFNCIGCRNPVRFSIFDLDESNSELVCSQCSKKYTFNDETLERQLRKFEALCRQIHESEEILGNTAVGVDIGEHHVAIPYKLLLTRLTSSLNLKIGKEQIAISFRMEPSRDMPEIEPIR